MTEMSKDDKILVRAHWHVPPGAEFIAVESYETHFVVIYRYFGVRTNCSVKVLL